MLKAAARSALQQKANALASELAVTRAKQAETHAMQLIALVENLQKSVETEKNTKYINSQLQSEIKKYKALIERYREEAEVEKEKAKIYRGWKMRGCGIYRTIFRIWNK